MYARGVTDEQISLYGLGHLRGKLPVGDWPVGFTQWCAIGDRLDDVVLFPLTNALGAVRGLQFRHVARDRGGYMDYIEVNDEAILFGLGQAAPHLWAGQAAFLVEGAFDLFPVQRVFPATISTLTARVTDPFLRVLRRLASRVWLGYDMDVPGRRACERYQKQLSSEFDARVVLYPRVPMVGSGNTAKDPSDLWEAWGDARIQEFLRALLGSHKEPSDAQGICDR